MTAAAPTSPGTRAPAPVLSESVRAPLAIGSLFLLALALVYRPMLGIEFLLMDDYSHLFGGEDLRSLILGTCRPLYYVLIRAMGWFVGGDYARVVLLRALGAVLAAGTALFIAVLAHGRGLRWTSAACLALLMVTLPAFRVLVFWLVALPFFLAVVFSALAFLAVRRGTDSSRSRARRGVSVTAGVGLLLAALCVHQSAAMFCFPVAALFALTASPDAWPGQEREHLLHGATVAASLALYWVLARVGISLAGVELAERGGLETDVVAKAAWFLASPLPNSLDFWNIPHRWWGALLSFLVAASGCVLALLRASRRTPSLLRSEARRWLYLGALVPLSFLPSLVTRDYWPCYRTLLPMSAVLLLLFVNGVTELVSVTGTRRRGRDVVLRSLLVFLVAVSLGLTRQTVLHGVAEPNAIELDFLRDALAGSDPTRYTHVHLIRPDWQMRVAAILPVGEYGMLSSHMYRVPIGMINYCLLSLGRMPAEAITLGNADEPVPAAPDVLVVNMGDLRQRFRASLMKRGQADGSP